MSPSPTYVYKILPGSTVNPHFALPIPLPAGLEVPATDVDLKDGFMHLSQASQVPGVLSRFFGDVDAVTILKVNYGRLSGFKIVKWERSTDGEEYPHLYAQLEGEYVQDIKEVNKAGSLDWTATVDSLVATKFLE